MKKAERKQSISDNRRGRVKNKLLVLKSIHRDREEPEQMYIASPIVPVMVSLIVP